MKFSPFPDNEDERLEELESYKILDTLPEESFDDITRLASKICDTPISLITLLDGSRQWFKSRHGTDLSETPREQAFCAHAILHPGEALVVASAHDDERFMNNPLVTEDPGIDFYAGIPLVTKSGFALGSLCVIDTVPHSLSDEKIEILRLLANQVVKLLELHRQVEQQKLLKTRLEKTVKNLQEFSQIVAHDIKSPVRNMKKFAELILEDFGSRLDVKVIDHIEHIVSNANKSQLYIDGVLKYSKNVYFLKHEKTEVDLSRLIGDIASQQTPPQGITITFPLNLRPILTSRSALQIVLTNLISNAVKHNDKEDGKIDIEVEVLESNATFRIIDNGPGIPSSELEKIFTLFYKVNNQDLSAEEGTGIGLSVVQRIIDELEGEIFVETTLGKGSTFIIKIPI